jgi:hypothetical protein
MLFVVYNKDSGDIDQAVKNYEPAGYDKLLEDRGLNFIVRDDIHQLIKPGFAYVDIKTEELLERPDMPITLDNEKILAGKGSAIFRGIPRDAKLTIAAAGAILHQLDPFDSDELELSIPLPCTYVITIQKWPFKDYQKSIEAVNG